ncbi:MAG: hypothetical protein AAFP19_14010 [Bacteroidota bacterium]
MQLDNSVKYQRIGSKLLEGLLGIAITISFFALIQYILIGSAEIKESTLSFGGILLVILIAVIVNETIEYNQKYYEYLSNSNYLRLRQRGDMTINIANPKKLFDNLERQILERNNGWWRSKRRERSMAFQTKKGSFLNPQAGDRIIIKVEGSNQVRIESAPLNKFTFADSARNLGNIIFLKNQIEKAAIDKLDKV